MKNNQSTDERKPVCRGKRLGSFGRRTGILFCAGLLCAVILTGCGTPQSTAGQNVSEQDSGAGQNDSEQAPGTVQETAENDSGAAQTIIFTDSCGREVEIPAQIDRIAPSGNVAQMILMTVAPERLVGLAEAPDPGQLPYLPDEADSLPVFGQFYGKKADMNLEALMASGPQLIIDLGDPKDGLDEDMDALWAQTGIPAIHIDASLDELAHAYRTLGELLDAEEKTEPCALFIEETLSLAAEGSARIPEQDRKTVLFGTGPAGLNTNAAGSSQADAIELVGGVNAIVTETVSHKNGGTPVSPETIYAADPDVIILTAEGPYDELAANEWSGLTAVKNGTYYEIPALPYCWMSTPPSVNRILGIRWIGNLLYPEIYDYDMVDAAREYYKIFWQYDLTDKEAEEMLEKSTMKDIPQN